MIKWLTGLRKFTGPNFFFVDQSNLLDFHMVTHYFLVDDWWCPIWQCWRFFFFAQHINEFKSVFKADEWKSSSDFTFSYILLLLLFFLGQYSTHELDMHVLDWLTLKVVQQCFPLNSNRMRKKRTNFIFFFRVLNRLH